MLTVYLMLAACGGGEDYETVDERQCPDPVVTLGTPIIEGDRCSNDSTENTPQV